MIHIQNNFTRALNLRHPVAMAPMFLVTNESMLRQSIEAGILGCFPSLNYRKEADLTHILSNLNKFMADRKGQPGNYGVNLIVQKSNIYYERHLHICVEQKVPVYITSLGNPRQTIEAA